MRLIQLIDSCGENFGLYNCSKPIEEVTNEQIEIALAKNSELCDDGEYDKGEALLKEIGVERVFTELEVTLKD